MKLKELRPYQFRPKERDNQAKFGQGKNGRNRERMKKREAGKEKGRKGERKFQKEC